MYRNRARAAHKLHQPVQQPQAQQQQQQQQPQHMQQQAGGWGQQGSQEHQGFNDQLKTGETPGVNFYNPAAYQNGTNGQPVSEQSGQNGSDFVQTSNWNNYHLVTDQNQNQESNLNNQEQVSQEVGKSEYSQIYNSNQQQESPALHLDPSGQWYWDYQQQQWLPYYQQQQQEIETATAAVEENSIEKLTAGLEQLTTSVVSPEEQQNNLDPKPEYDQNYIQAQHEVSLTQEGEFNAHQLSSSSQQDFQQQHHTLHQEHHSGQQPSAVHQEQFQEQQNHSFPQEQHTEQQQHPVQYTDQQQYQAQYTEQQHHQEQYTEQQQQYAYQSQFTEQQDNTPVNLPNTEKPVEHENEKNLNTDAQNEHSSQYQNPAEHHQQQQTLFHQVHDAPYDRQPSQPPALLEQYPQQSNPEQQSNHFGEQLDQRQQLHQPQNTFQPQQPEVGVVPSNMSDFGGSVGESWDKMSDIQGDQSINRASRTPELIQDTPVMSPTSVLDVAPTPTQASHIMESVTAPISMVAPPPMSMLGASGSSLLASEAPHSMAPLPAPQVAPATMQATESVEPSANPGQFSSMLAEIPTFPKPLVSPPAQLGHSSEDTGSPNVDDKASLSSGPAFSAPPFREETGPSSGHGPSAPGAAVAVSASPAPLIEFSPRPPGPGAVQAPPSPLAPSSYSLGPPDLVDHRPNSSQPEIVSDISQPGPHQLPPLRSVPPPDMFASLPGSGSGVARSLGPDLTSQSGGQQDEGVSSHDQHYEFYNQAYQANHTPQPQGGMPDVTGGQHVSSSQPPQQMASQVKAPDILRTESHGPSSLSSVPSSDRNLFMETGQLDDEDVDRVAQQNIPTYPQQNIIPTSQSAAPSSLGMPIASNVPPMLGAMSLPPMVGAPPLPPMVGGNEQVTPGLMRMVVGESQSFPPPPLVGSNPPSGLRLVEGDTHPVPQLVAREVEGQSHPPPSSTPIYQQLPDAREPVEGESQPPPAPRPTSGPLVPPIQPLPSSHPESSLHQGGPAEARSAAAGSDRRDVDVMGGPPPPVARPAPLPTPGRDITGEESRGKFSRRNEYDGSEEDTRGERDSDSDQARRYGASRRNNRRTVSPGARSGASHRGPPARIERNSYRSSTDRDSEEVGRRYGGDRRHEKEDRRHEKDDRRHRDNRTQERDNRSYYDRRDRDRREDDRRSNRGGDNRGFREVKREPRDYYGDSRNSVYDGDYNRPSRPGSRAGSVSQYGGDLDHSFSRGDRNMMNQSMQMQAMMEQQAMMQRQYMEQQRMMMMNPMQLQLQTAVVEMEKALEESSNVMIYKQHWDYYQSKPGALEKLKAENPLMHHLIMHFRQNFWWKVEELMDRKGSVSATPSNATLGTADPSVLGPGAVAATTSFATDFHSGQLEQEQSSIQVPQEGVVQEQQVEGFQVLPERLTPLMFTRPHVCARISANGTLVKVEAASPEDGQTAVVELHSVASLLRDTRQYQELAAFPGPLKPGVTHKNDVIKFCERKIAGVEERMGLADRESYVLLWEMLILLLRQKGQVEGSDLAELLLGREEKVREEERGVTSSSASSVHNDTDLVVMDRSLVNSGGDLVDPVGRFRSYLLHGNKVEGLEFAMKAVLWGHALFLASKMDQRTYAGVMTRFANGLAINDPLQTLYQLMSSRMPSAMKQCADQRWGDWRPHLAMILSNPLPGSDINRKSMITLGDSLLAKGQLYAAQFCYIVSAAEWGSFSRKSSKLVLLCSSVADKSLEEFASTEAIQCTEIYEFVQRLGNKEFNMPTLQPYKFLHCLRLVEAGLSTTGQDYLRVLADHVVEHGREGVEEDTVPGWVQATQHLAEKLKYLDPVYTTSVGEISEIPDPDWLVRFRETVLELQQSPQSYSDQQYNDQQVTDQQAYDHQAYDQQSYNPETSDQYSSERYEQEQPGENISSEGQPQTTDQPNQDEQNYYYQQQGYEQNGYHQQPVYDQQVSYDQQQAYDQQPSYDQQQQSYDQPTSYDQSQSYEQQPVPPSEDPNQEAEGTTTTAQPAMFYNPAELGTTNSNSAPTFFNPASVPPIPETAGRRPSVSGKRSRTVSVTESPTHGFMPPAPESIVGQMPPMNTLQPTQNTMPPPQNTLPPSLNTLPPVQEKLPQEGEKKADPAEAEKKKKTEPKAKGGPKSSWFGGIFSKIIQPKNQVHLPDDKPGNESIVFNEATGKWENKDGEDDSLAPAAPPPMDPQFSAGGMPSSGGPGQGPPGAAAPNYRAGLGKRKGGRGYVDALGQAGMSKPVSAGPSLLTDGAPPPLTSGPPGMMPPTGPPAMFNPNLTPMSSEGPTSLQTDTGVVDTSPALPMMMFNPGTMGGLGPDQPPGF